MTNEELLLECKKGLDIPVASTDFDGPLLQKIAAVKGFMVGAGVSEEGMGSALATGTIVLGVSDLWNSKSGEINFSPVFCTLLVQLRSG